MQELINNALCVISKETFGEYEIHDIQTNITWVDNPYGDKYAIVPTDMVQDIMATNGFCDIELNEDGTEIVSFTARAIPEIPVPEAPPSAEERLVALENAMLEMLGVTSND